MLAILATAAMLAAKSGGNDRGLRLGIELNTHATAAWVALDKGLFNTHGVHVDSILRFRTGVELAAAFSKGEIDAAWACLAPIIKIIDKGIPLYIVEATHYYGYGCVGRPGINSLRDLLSLRHEPVVAVTGNGAQTHILLLKAMEKYGFRARIVFMKPPAILSAVVTGSVDAACLPEHYLSVAESKGLHVLLTAQDLWPNMPGSYLVVSESLLKKRPGVVCRLAEINEEATRLALENTVEAAKIDARELGAPVEVVERSLGRLKLTTAINVSEVQALADLMYSHGLIKHRINVSNYIVDLSKLCSR
ncbi:hypothetical protein PYJP_00430 [Pyrofollis japonicus]|uniref:ABC transporter substrate-binding protein n=1 Tax=Pyrofollis japonicus TaxID=3060460 RepID=UPI00295A809B|nr:ABC transporter substrate-binding protein [Pyrofollis japonicus]BEP16691.1 hypothetical protein PYJP_00430 [Pyrofollis japonicus]